MPPHSTPPGGWPAQPPPPLPPGYGWGRQLWIAWCVLWAAGWAVLALVTFPVGTLLFGPLAVLSGFATALGRPREVIVHPAPVQPPPRAIGR